MAFFKVRFFAHIFGVRLTLLRPQRPPHIKRSTTIPIQTKNQIRTRLESQIREIPIPPVHRPVKRSIHPLLPIPPGFDHIPIRRHQIRGVGIQEELSALTAQRDVDSDLSIEIHLLFFAVEAPAAGEVQGGVA